MPVRSKRYTQARQLVDRMKTYSVEEGIDILKKFPSVKFNETVEMHLKLGIDPAKSDQQVRGTVSLPHGTGKETRVLVFARGEQAEAAKSAGADFVGSDELVQQIQSGWTDFDVAIATPDMMRDIGKLGKVLGPRGLMPSPKAGTVTTDVVDAVKGFKAGRIEVKNDKTGNLHLPVGKKSFEPQKLLENFVSALNQINRMKPSGSKGRFVQRAFITTTMGVGIKVEVSRETEK
ncbi:MAG TPA: 50S ribosomal protein L1 [Mesotoga infera]|nr:50S ribosomal protein L1 [Mesotoga sp.]HON28039.1 50S ribosomal protein L1 [Mesotoga infera]HPD37181.1 50S ribosomal protein L1 [Mesotoga infera]HRR43873.1 50S ribosomal protein L1 [Mesotoga sp.]HRV00479.1 50S ribosomal protein L1 [Mesotoga sp.]